MQLALAFGRACRLVYDDSRWEQYEPMVRQCWERMPTDLGWEAAEEAIRTGWNQCAPNAMIDQER